MPRTFEYVIVGGGAAAATAAEAIRKRDPGGSLAIFTREWAPPYQRPPLSKELLQNRSALEDALMFPASWYLEHDIDVFVGVEVTGLAKDRRAVETKAGDVAYQHLLLATGAVPLHLKLPGVELDGVYTLRTYVDAERLRGVRSSAQRVIMIGSGFIGMEVAASLRSGGCEITIVTIDPSLYARFGGPVSEYAKSLFDRHGVRTILNTGLASIEGKGRAEAVKLKDGTRLEADAVIIGIGAAPDVALAQAGGVRVDNGIVVDDRLRTSVPDIYAAGDVARFPSIDGQLIRVEHFDHAYASGAAAGANMAGADQPYRYVPFFWSDVFELSFEFVGDPRGDSQIVQGTLESGSFVVEYRERDRLRGALLARRTSEERDAYRDRLGSMAALK
jgi:3-phenylpropionate/trans-cinnamate dioxygenase ferredoxin reductase subunit